MQAGSAELEKIKRWCALQERSHFETRLKLQRAGFSPVAVQSVLADLIASNFLNEERFALTFAGGKFRMKHWGKIKIRAELRKHQVSEANLNLALDSLPEKEYLQQAKKLLEKKRKDLKPSNTYIQRAHLYRYLAAKGYEPDLIHQLLEAHFSPYES